MKNETNELTLKEMITKVVNSSTDFENSNTDLKRKYIVWNIEAFNIIASSVQSYKGSFGTGYPFYILDNKLQGTLPIISEQIRYNIELLEDLRMSYNLSELRLRKWYCENCLKTKYFPMPDLKKICGPCPNVPKTLKPRKLINRLPDLDMWIVVNDGDTQDVQEDLIIKFSKYGISSSDIDPIKTINDFYKISQYIKAGKTPDMFLPMDAHIMEYSKLKRLIEQVPDTLNSAKINGTIPFLPIHPISYRKMWQHDDEAYNFIYDFLSAFTSFNFEGELQEALNNSRYRVITEHSPEELFSFLTDSATPANFRRFQSPELKETFYKRLESWKSIKDKTFDEEFKPNSNNSGDEPEL